MAQSDSVIADTSHEGFDGQKSQIGDSVVAKQRSLQKWIQAKIGTSFQKEAGSRLQGFSAQKEVSIQEGHHQESGQELAEGQHLLPVPGGPSFGRNHPGHFQDHLPLHDCRGEVKLNSHAVLSKLLSTINIVIKPMSTSYYSVPSEAQEQIVTAIRQKVRKLNSRKFWYSTFSTLLSAIYTHIGYKRIE